MGFNLVFKWLNVFLLGDYMPTETEDKQHIGCDFFLFPNITTNQTLFHMESGTI